MVIEYDISMQERRFPTVSDFDKAYYLEVAKDIVRGEFGEITSNNVLLSMIRFAEVHRALGHETEVVSDGTDVLLRRKSTQA